MKCGCHRSKVKMLLLQRCVLHKIHMVDGQNTHNQIYERKVQTCVRSDSILCIPFILSRSPNEAGYMYTCMRCMRNSNPEIMIACTSSPAININKIILSELYCEIMISSHMTIISYQLHQEKMLLENILLIHPLSSNIYVIYKFSILLIYMYFLQNQ